MPFEIRRSQLISPFGSGAIVDLPGNLSVIIASPESWLVNDTYANNEKFRIVDEHRLAARLGVQYFRWPPEYVSNGHGPNGQAERLTVPAYRFPLWHYCGQCGRMQFLHDDANEHTQQCELCNREGTLLPFRWVAACPQGHIQDVPLKEWHTQFVGNCNQEPRLRYRATGGGDSLHGIRIECINNGCGAAANLDQIFGHAFTCGGKRPWLRAANVNAQCQELLTITLKGATNAYIAEVRSSLFIPEGANDRDVLLQQIWQQNEQAIRGFHNMGNDGQALNGIIGFIFDQYQSRFAEVNVDRTAWAEFAHERLQPVHDDGQVQVVDDEESFRHHEFTVFCDAAHRQPTKDLSMRERPIADYNWDGICENDLIERVVLLDKLRETRALIGFQRIDVQAQHQLDPGVLKQMMTGNENADWLPAHIVRGEGIFIKFNDNLLNEWEGRPGATEHFGRFNGRVAALDPRYQDGGLNARFIMLHTLAHLLIRRLTYNCGYGSSSLRERIYCHNANPQNPMNAIVIYTASGDSEGSLGGLVKQGEPGFLERIFREALYEAEWCSADPVCADLSHEGGQGPNSVNGAACHNCALLPETSCESFNKYLDRKFVLDPEGQVPSLFSLRV